MLEEFAGGGEEIVDNEMAFDMLQELERIFRGTYRFQDVPLFLEHPADQFLVVDVVFDDQDGLTHVSAPTGWRRVARTFCNTESTSRFAWPAPLASTRPATDARP